MGALKRLSLKELAWLEPALLPGKAPRAAPGQWYEPWMAPFIERIRQKKKRGAYTRAKGNINTLRSVFLECNEFKPQDTKSLWDWLGDAARHSRGEGLAVPLTAINPSNNRYWVTDSSASIMRHIAFSFNIPASRFGSLLNCF